MRTIETFLNRVQKMTTSRSKEIRLTYEEANLLCAEIGLLLNRNVEEAEKADTQIVISGGSLKPPQSK